MQPGSELPENIKDAVRDQIGVDPDQTDDGAAAGTLTEAAASGDLERMSQLVVDGADPAGQDLDTGLSPLMMAVDREHVEAAQWLLSKHVPTDARDFDGQTALHYAVLVENPKLVALLLASGATPDVLDSQGLSPVTLAEEIGNDDVSAAFVI